MNYGQVFGHLRQLFGVVFLRFKAVPRLWCVWLVGVTLGSLFRLSSIEAQVVLRQPAMRWWRNR